MSPKAHERLTLAALLILASCVFFTGIGWGLPSRTADPFLFGSRAPWSGAEILRLTERSTSRWEDPDRGADVDADPRSPLNEAVVVNGTDGDRAEIVRRYRLFTYQPDEMITLMALAKMHVPRDLDPRLYQYGGLWIYPVGALLKAASLRHLVDLRGGPEGLAYYLDHPAAFGRFYVVARLYSVAWGLVGVWGVFRLVRRVQGAIAPAALATACFILMPVVVNAAHEAKPHLAGVVLVLLAVTAAADYVQSGRWRHAILAGIFCGAAVGMVLSTAPVFAILPVMVLLRRMRVTRRLAVCVAALFIGAAVYAASNPYVIKHAVTGGAPLQSNLANSRAFYHVGHPLAGALNAIVLAAEGMSPVLFIAGVVGAIALAVRAIRSRRDTAPAEVRRRATGLLLAVPALLTAGQAALVAAGKPGEFGRFLLLTDVFLAVEAIVAVATFIRPPRRVRWAGGVLVVTTAWYAVGYVRGFVLDSRELTPRLVEAERIRTLSQLHGRRVAVVAEPAPYGLPPVDLFTMEIVVLPRDRAEQWERAPADLLVRAVDAAPADAEGDDGEHGWNGCSTPISWAAKPFEVRVR